MSKLRSNVLANFLGQGWAALLQLVFTPIYIKLIGIEAYGLIGFYVSLQVTVQIFDLGLGPTMTRELARRSGSPEQLGAARDLVKTIGRVYWCVAGLIAATVLLSAPLIAAHVIQTHSLPKGTVRDAIMLMALLIPIQWAVNLHQGALVGLERQVLVNALRIVASTCGAVGAALILWLVSSTITAFFLWQGLVAIAYFLATSFFLDRALPPMIGKPRFRVSLLREVRHFAAGMSGITVAGIVLTQLDKWILINLLPLDIFGYYILAGVVANALYVFITPLFNGFFPRFSILVAQGSSDQLKKLYHFGAQAMAMVVIPAAVVLSLFSREVLLLWTRNPEAASISAPLVSILVWGTALNGLMNIPYALQLAYGWTRLALGINLIAMGFFVPAILALTLWFGSTGAAAAWVAFNLFFAFLAVPLTHGRFFIGGEGNRVTTDVLFSIGAAFVVIGAARLAYPPGMSAVAQALFIAGSYVMGVVTAGLCGAKTREWMLGQSRKIYSNIG